MSEPQPLDEKIEDLIKEITSLYGSAQGEQKSMLRIQKETLLALKEIMTFTEDALNEIGSGQSPFDQESILWIRRWVDQSVEAFSVVLGSLPAGEAHDLYEAMIKEGKDISAFLGGALSDDEEEEEEEES